MGEDCSPHRGRIFQRMRILLLNSLLEPYKVGGAELSVMKLANSLAANGHQVKLLTLEHPLRRTESQAVTNGLEILELRHYPFSLFKKNRFLPSNKVLWHILDSISLSHQSRIKKILNDFQPEVIHTNNLTGIGTFIWREARRRRIPVVHTTRDFFLVCLRSTMFKKNENCLTQCGKCKFFRRKILKDSQLVSSAVGISSAILEEHLNIGYFVNSNFNRVIHNTPKKELISKSSTPLIGLSRDADGINFLFVGQLIPEKGIEFLINIFRQGPFENEKLLIAGSGPSKFVKGLKLLASTNPNIIFLGRVNLDEINSKIDYLLVPSLWREPFGRVVFDAVNLDCKLIVSNAKGLVEAVKLTPVPSVVLETGNYLSWKDLIVSLSKKQDLNLFHSPKISLNMSSEDFLEYELLFMRMETKDYNS